jgi:hypothetical protein
MTRPRTPSARTSNGLKMRQRERTIVIDGRNRMRSVTRGVNGTRALRRSGRWWILKGPHFMKVMNTVGPSDERNRSSLLEAETATPIRFTRQARRRVVRGVVTNWAPKRVRVRTTHFPVLRGATPKKKLSRRQRQSRAGRLDPISNALFLPDGTA